MLLNLINEIVKSKTGRIMEEIKSIYGPDSQKIELLVSVNLLEKIKNWLQWHPNSGERPPHGFQDEKDIVQAIDQTLNMIFDNENEEL